MKKIITAFAAFLLIQNITLADTVHVGTFADLQTYLGQTTSPRTIILDAALDATANLTTQAGTNLTVDGGGFTLSGQNSYVGFNVSSGRTLTLQNVVFSNFTRADGGAISNAATTTILSGTFNDNFVTNRGGAIYNSGSMFNITSSEGSITFSDNSSTNASTPGGGGAIYNQSGTMNISSAGNDINFSKNTAQNSGGAIYAYAGAINITSNDGDIIFSENETKNYGGAIVTATSAVLNIEAKNGKIVFNKNKTTSTASSSGGGAISNWYTMNVTSNGGEVIFSENSSYQGGAIYTNSSGVANFTAKSDAITFEKNSATNQGGAIYNTSGRTVTLTADGGDIIFKDNQAAGGGAIYNAGILTLTTSDGSNIAFSNNKAGASLNDIHTTSTINITGTGGKVTLGGGISGNNNITKTSTGEVVFGQDAINRNFTGTFTQNAGTTTYYGELLGGTNNINNSTLNLWQTSTNVNIGNLGLNAVNVNSVNNVINTFNITNFSAAGINNFSVDVDGALGVSDLFNVINGSGSGTLNVDTFKVLYAPVAEVIDLQIFTGDILGYTFTSSESEVVTPIYIYKVKSLQDEGQDGYFRLFRSGGDDPPDPVPPVNINKQVFRGSAATLAVYQNQLVVNNTLFDHVYLDSQVNNIAFNNANKYAAGTEIFAPYQYSRRDGSVWLKNYVVLEKLSMTRGVNINNSAYGAIVGVDLPVKRLGKGWEFLPTAFIAYNGGRQSFDNVTMYQNGGQGGFMGSFMKNDFLGSILAYGGGYGNEMSLQGTTDRTGNWFAGTAAKAAYNFHPTKRLIIQPNALVSYNIFGRQNWHSDYGALSMNSGYLNGINVAPGLNLIYGRETWSVYLTTQYMYNINDRIGGVAGPVNIPELKMRHGFFEYGIGGTKTFKQRLMTYAQVVFRNGGRTGVGFQVGLNWML